MSIPSGGGGGGGGGGAAKAWYGPLVSLENQFTDHASALSLSCQIPF